MSLISVLVPVFNHAEYLPPALDSLQAQTHGELDILVVDDGSRDASGRVAAGRAARDSRIRVAAWPENRGVYQARLAGIERARGEFVAFLDADDQCRPAFLATLARRASEYGADMVECDFEVVPARRGRRAYARPKSHYARHPPPPVRTGRETFRDLLRPTAWTAVWNRLYRTAMLRAAVERLPADLRAARLDACEDLLLNAAFALEEPRAVFEPGAWYRYFVRDRSTSQVREAAAIRRYMEDDRRALAFCAARLAPEERPAFAERKIAHARAALGYLREYAARGDEAGFDALLEDLAAAYGGALALAMERDPFGVSGRRGWPFHAAALLRHVKRALFR